MIKMSVIPVTLSDAKRKSKPRSPTQRSLELLRADGWLVAVVEHWNPFAHIRQDLFGFIDLLAIQGDYTLAVQVTTAENMAARRAKIQAEPRAAIWQSASRGIAIHGWHKRGGKWECKEERF